MTELDLRILAGFIAFVLMVVLVYSIRSFQMYLKEKREKYLDSLPQMDDGDITRVYFKDEEKK